MPGRSAFSLDRRGCLRHSSAPIGCTAYFLLAHVSSLTEITDYEVRRELLRLHASAALRRLDLLCGQLEYIEITTLAMRRAAELWAQVRQQGQPTADPHALDGDVILAAQALLAAGPSDTIVVATTNVGHLSRLVPAQRWQEIA
jgi:predicted nucleic acid-binding protein